MSLFSSKTCLFLWFLLTKQNKTQKVANKRRKEGRDEEIVYKHQIINKRSTRDEREKMCKFLPTHCLVKMGVETPKGKLIVWCINVLGFWILNNFLMILFLKKEFYYVSTFTSSRTKQILGIRLNLNGSNWIFFFITFKLILLLTSWIHD